MSPNHWAYLYPINQIMTVVQQIWDAAYLVKLIVNILNKIINTAYLTGNFLLTAISYALIISK